MQTYASCLLNEDKNIPPYSLFLTQYSGQFAILIPAREETKT